MAERLPGVREPLPLTLAVPRGRAVIRQGDSGSGLWVVESGALVRSSYHADEQIPERRKGLLAG